MIGNRSYRQQRNADPSDPLAMMTSLGSAASQLLAALFTHPAPSASVSELAAASKVATATAARTVERLVEAGLVTDERSGRERLLRWNETSAYAPAIEDLLWISHGATPPPTSGLQVTAMYAAGPPLKVSDCDVADLIPACLQPGIRGGALAQTEPEAPGPRADQVRALVLTLQRSSLRLRTEPWLQEAYRRWHIEHDRDLIHLTLHQGAGLHQATSVLRAATRNQDPGTSIAPSVWAHAIYALVAEVSIATQIAERASALADAAVQRRADERQAHRDARAGAAQHQGVPTDADRSASSPLPTGQHDAEGPNPLLTRAKGDPGAGIERVLTIQCEALAEAMSARVTTMSAHPSFTAWLAANPADPDHPYPLLTR